MPNTTELQSLFDTEAGLTILYEGLLQAQNEMGEGIAIIEGERFIFLNDALCKIYGYSREELLALPSFLEIVDPDDHKRIADRFRQRFIESNNLSDYLEIIGLHKEGHSINIAYSLKLMNIHGRKLLFSIIRDITDRKKNEELINKKTTQLTEAQALAHIGSWDWDIVANKIEWSDELYKLFGFTPHEIESNFEEYLNLIHPDDREEVNRIVQKALSDHQPFKFYHRIILKDGSERTLYGRGKVFKDENNVITRMGGTAQDVTERKKIQDALKYRTDQFAEAQKSAHIGSWDWNVITNEIEWSDELYRLHGFVPQEFEITYENSIMYIHPEDREYVNRIAQQQYTDHNKTDIFYRIIRRYGAERIFHGKGTVFTDNSGKKIRMSGTIQDVTEQKTAENNLIQFQHFFNTTSDLACIANTEGSFEIVNQSFVDKLGYTEKELTEQQFFNFVHPDDIPATLNIVAQLKGGAPTVNFTNRYRKKDGNYLWFAWNSTPNAATGKLYAMARDITEQKQNELELIRLKEVAENSEKIKEQFLTNMSHEIRTPMNAIIGFTDLLLKRELGDAEKDFVKTIKLSGENLLGIINDVLDISKIESKSLTFEQRPLSIKEALNSTNLILSQKAIEKNLNLSFICSNTVPEVLLGDSIRLSQILINLVGNAIKFTKDGTINVMAKKLSEEGEICHITFSVKDSGIGIPEDQLQHIFERFRQAESHTNRHFGGTGLGLSITKELVELQGGTISVKSIEGMGSIFAFTLPFKKTKEAYKIKSTKHHELSSEEAKNLNVLVVEDNPINIKFITSIFAEYGINTDIAENGKLAVEKIKCTKYSVVLMDIEMPEMNGYEATMVIRNELKSDIPIIAMTAHAMNGEKEKCLGFGMTDYISKPVDLHLLFEKIFDVTSNSKNKNTNMGNIINLDYLYTSVGGNKEIIVELFDIFLKQIPESLLVLDEAVSKADYLTIKQLSHKLKSTVSVMGISGLNPVLSEMESLGKAADPEGLETIKSLFGQVKEISSKAVVEIEDEKSKIG
ncbi:MAG: PAS domain-containing protein [Chitinophagaceae bacterium]